MKYASASVAITNYFFNKHEVHSGYYYEVSSDCNHIL